jgi:transcriptional regulator with XRE-family HTH domain
MSELMLEGVTPEWTLTDRLRKAREHRGLDQAQLAELIGVHRRSVVNYELGRTQPRRPQLIAWALATGVALDWLEGDVRPKGFEPLTFWSVVWAYLVRLVQDDDELRCTLCGHFISPIYDRWVFCRHSIEHMRCHERESIRADDLALAA